MSGKTFLQTELSNIGITYPADFDFSSINCFKRNLNKIDFYQFSYYSIVFCMC